MEGIDFVLKVFFSVSVSVVVLVFQLKADSALA